MEAVEGPCLTGRSSESREQTKEVPRGMRKSQGRHRKRTDGKGGVAERTALGTGAGMRFGVGTTQRSWASKGQRQGAGEWPRKDPKA